jgi:hypothetical protein
MFQQQTADADWDGADDEQPREPLARTVDAPVTQ